MIVAWEDIHMHFSPDGILPEIITGQYRMYIIHSL